MRPIAEAMTVAAACPMTARLSVVAEDGLAAFVGWPPLTEPPAAHH
jgi:hypothetical protein